MNVIDIFAPDYWIRAVLLDSVGKTCVIKGQTVSADAVAFCGERIAPAREGLEPREFLENADDPNSLAWPYMLFGPSRDGVFDRYAQENIGLDGEYLIRSFHREDYTAPVDVEEANKPGLIAIQNCFQGVPFTDAVTGIVHGCEIIRPHRRLYGEVGQRVSELGVIARIFSN